MNPINLKSIDVEGSINSTAYVCKAEFMELNTPLLVIVPKEESNSLPTNYQEIFNATEKTVIHHHVVDAQSFGHVATATSSFKNGNWTI
jgi:hypothetical protein|tara:strand:- start:4954 stop:5220 length:267 start_codon:yes stop_codon:yes gene_type:complete